MEIKDIARLYRMIEEEAAVHEQRNQLTRFIGKGGITAEDVDTFTKKLEPGDFILLCSDGLHEYLEDYTIARIIREAETPQQAVDNLIARLKDIGQDDIGAVIIQAQ